MVPQVIRLNALSPYHREHHDVMMQMHLLPDVVLILEVVDVVLMLHHFDGGVDVHVLTRNTAY
jgi:hypothetical protein